MGQLLIAGFKGTSAGTDARRALLEYQVGGVILFDRNVSDAAQLAGLVNELQALNSQGIPLLVCADQEGGTVTRMPPEVDELPIACRFGQIDDPDNRLDACFLFGQALAAQCTAFGINMDFAPVMDIWSSPTNSVIGRRAFGTTAEEVCGPANETAWGMMSGGVIPVVKHFPGHGDTAVDSHYGLPVVDKSLEELREMELVPFRQAVEGTCVHGAAGEDSAVPAVMVGHILMKAIDPDRPASLSSAVVTGLLREEMGFDGVVCTDDLTMKAVSRPYGVGESAVLALEAGCDLLLICHGPDNVTAAYEALTAAVESGRITEARLDESVCRILKLKTDFHITGAPAAAPVDVAGLNARTAEVWAAMGSRSENRSPGEEVIKALWRR